MILHLNLLLKKKNAIVLRYYAIENVLEIFVQNFHLIF